MSNVRQFFSVPPNCNTSTGCIITQPMDSIIRDGYLECNGAVYSRTTYSRLFGVIGTLYGSTASTNFKVPDLRGLFVRGWGGNSASVGSYQADSYQPHSHPYKLRTGVDTYVGPSAANDTTGGAINMFSDDLNTTDNVETRPVNISVIYCIRYI